MGKTILTLNNINLEQIKNTLETRLSNDYKFSLKRNILLMKNGSVEVFIKPQDNGNFVVNTSSNRYIMMIPMGIIAGVGTRFGGFIDIFLAVLIIGYLILGVANLINKEKIKSIENETLSILRNI